jgi:hypothetical protein
MESWLVWNAALCACALPLGGRMAGLPAPGKCPMGASVLLNAVLAAVPVYLPPLGMLPLLGLPGAVAICFHRQGLPTCVRCTFTTLLASMMTGGVMTALTTAGLDGSASAGIAIALSLIACLLVRMLPAALCDIRQVELRVDEERVLLPAMLDSGNLLRDPVTGRPVLVIPVRAARALFPDLGDPSRLTELPLGFRLLNVRTAAGSSLLPMFRPDECKIYVNGSACRADLLVAVTGQEHGGVQALVPMSALPADALPT